ncbi:MAG: NAD(P)-binding domain-containing protein, partial [Candidatus Binatota bacterium]
MDIRTIAVLGAGNGGCAAAVDLTLRGYEVRLYSRSQSTLQPILQRGGIEIVEAGKQAFACPRLVTPDMAEAVAGAELVMIVAPASAHEKLAVGLSSHLSDGQIIFLNPGHTGGSLHLAAILRGQGVKEKIRICETVTLSYICRLIG